MGNKYILLVVLGLVLTAIQAKAQNSGKVSGTVTDAQSGETLPGVNILVKGTSTGASTDADGQYELTVESLQDTLVVSFVGYRTKEVPIGERTTVDVNLQPQAILGEEMVVVGYGEQSKDLMTSSVSTVTSDEITKVPVVNLANALTGQAPGVSVMQTTSQPGADNTNIYIRGIHSLNGEASHPIFVLDGIIMSNKRAVTQLDPSTIQSLSVLKGPAATAVYGVKGANGAIVVKTKRGEKGPTKVSINTQTGFQSPTEWLPMTNSSQFAKAYNEAQLTDGSNKDQLRFTPEALKAFKTGSHPLIYPDVNWPEFLFKKRTIQTKTDITLSGGTDNVRFFIAGGFLRQGGIFKSFARPNDVNPSYNRYNLRSNLDINVLPSTEISLTSNARIGSRRTIKNSSPSGNIWSKVISAVPFSGPSQFKDGKMILSGDKYIPGVKTNPLKWFYGQGYHQITENTLNLNLKLTQKLNAITDGLQLQLNGSYNTDFTYDKYFQTYDHAHFEPYFRSDIDPSAKNDSTVAFKLLGNSDVMHYEQSYGKSKNWYVEARLNYDHSFFDYHNIKVLALFGEHRTFYPSSFPGIPSNIVNTVARLDYNYKQRYLLQLSMGYNGSENFKKGQRFGFFPAVSGGWVITNEPFMPKSSFLSFLKLRASWGQVGNDTGVGRFLYLPSKYNLNTGGYSFGTDIAENKTGASEGRIGNPSVTWETSVKRDYGIDLRLFKDKLKMKFTYFHEVRSDILITRKTAPIYVAADLPAVNLGKLQNKGFEAEVYWGQEVGDFSYDVGGNISLAHNNILFKDEVPPLVPWQARTGRPVGQHFGYIFDGFYSKQEIANLDNGVPKPTWEVKRGFSKYEDINGDGTVNSKDKVPIGYPDVPELNVGSTLNLGYKNWSLSMTWAAAFHVNKWLAPNFKFPFGPQGRAAMMMWQYKGRWTPEKVKEGKEITYPRISLASRPRIKEEHSTLWLANARYVRLKNLHIGYKVSMSFLQDLGIETLQVFATGYNLLTFSPMLKKYKMDPERTYKTQGTPTSYPITRTVNFGAKISF